MSGTKEGPDDSEDNGILKDVSINNQEKRLQTFTKRFEARPEQNLIDVFKIGMQTSSSKPCLGTRADINSPYTWLSYDEVFALSINIGHFLARVLKLLPGTFVGIYSKNCAEWVIFELGCFHQNLVPVPLYDTLGPEAMDHILKQTAIKVLLCENSKNQANLKLLKNADQLKHVIQISGELPDANEVKHKVYSWQEALKAGEDNPAKGECSSRRDNLALLCYTSGTTGLPKGVQVTHGSLIAESLCMAEFLVIHGGSYVTPGTCDDIYISYLPLAHIFERIMHIFCFKHGMRIGFYRGDILTLVNDMQELKPTIFCTVPRLLNRIYDKTLASVSGSCLKSAIFSLALRKKTAQLAEGVIRKDSIWDSLVFSKIQSSTGNKIRLVIVGSAPLAEEVMRFSRAAFGCPIIEGYGQTETTAGSSVTLPGDSTTGNVGVPLFSNVIQLQDVPEMNYFVKDGCGEVCIRGLNVTNGYYRMNEETAKTIDKAGWLHTGDVGQWTPGGQLKIIDRKKNIFKLAQGEYVAPEKIEPIYITNPFVAQIFVDGDSLENFLLAVVVPSPEAVTAWAKQHNVSGSLHILCDNEKLKSDILISMQATGQASGLKNFEQVKDIHLHPEPFSVENGFLTPTFKSVRNELKRVFSETFKKMYFDLKQKTATS